MSIKTRIKRLFGVDGMEGEDPSLYSKDSGTHYSEKEGHKQRTIANEGLSSPHQEHWKKVDKKNRYER